MKDSPKKFGSVLRVLAVGIVSTVAISATVMLNPSQSRALPLSTGIISAKVSDHIGIDENGDPDGTTATNCVRYKPDNGGSSSDWVTHSSTPNEAQTAHGRDGFTCPSKLDMSEQSAVGIQPASATSFSSGVPFLLARVIHYNNPIHSSAEFWKGQLVLRMADFDNAPSIGLDWSMWETPNNADPCPNGSDENGCFDHIKFTSQIGDQIISQGGLDYRLIVTGFVPTPAKTECAKSPSGEVANEFWTNERASTHACIYAELSEIRKVVVTKTITGYEDEFIAPSSTFDFSTDGTLSGSPWNSGAFSLTPPNDGTASTKPVEIVESDEVTILEKSPSDSRWSLTDIQCYDFDEKGNLRPLPKGAVYDIDKQQVTLSNIPAPSDPSNPHINCEFTNTYTPAATLTLVKQLQGGPSQLSDFTLEAKGDDSAPTNGMTISGTSGESTVTNRVVPAGNYTLSESGPAGYVSDAGWSCNEAQTPQDRSPLLDNTITLADGAQVICSISNRFRTGDFRINVIVNAPSGALTIADPEFTGTYTCGTNEATLFSATQSSPFASSGLAAGQECTVTASQPVGNLSNDSFRWLSPTYSAQPVIIEDEATVAVTITYEVVQDFGTLVISKAVTGAAEGLVSGTTFSISVSCGEIYNQTLLVGVASPATTSNIPLGTTCVIGEIPPTSGLISAQYSWGIAPSSQSVVVNAANQAVTLVNNIIFTAATTTTTTTVATPTTTVAPPTTTVPAVELQVLFPAEEEQELQVLLPEAGSNVHWLMYVAILLMGMGAVLMTRRKVTN
jgi:hypothetical protein